VARVKKTENVVVLAKNLMLKGAYVISDHAKLRQGERGFTIGDIRNIIDTGYHKEEYADWNYAIRGKTLDNDQARICIAFAQEKHFVVITVIRLEV
jgi:hypothetical protein